MRKSWSLKRVLVVLWCIVAFPAGFISSLAIKLHYQIRETAARQTDELVRLTDYRDALANSDTENLQKGLDFWAQERSRVLKGLYEKDPSILDYAGSMDALNSIWFSYHDERSAGKLEGLLDWIPASPGIRARVAFQEHFVNSPNPAPELSIQQWIGEPRNLTSLRGKVVLIDFWGTWCVPCISGFSHVQSLYDGKKARGFEVIAVHLNSQRETIEPFLQGKPWTFAFAVDDGQTAKDYGVVALPTYCLIGRDGRVLWAPNPASPKYQFMTTEQFHVELDAALERALSEPVQGD